MTNSHVLDCSNTFKVSILTKAFWALPAHPRPRSLTKLDALSATVLSPVVASAWLWCDSNIWSADLWLTALVSISDVRNFFMSSRLSPDFLTAAWSVVRASLHVLNLASRCQHSNSVSDQLLIMLTSSHFVINDWTTASSTQSPALAVKHITPPR